MAGAAIMCGKAALRSGTGLVHMVVPKEIYPIVAGQLTEPIYTVLYQEHMLQQLDEAMEKATACVIGCGMGTSETAKLILTYVLKHFRHPIVLDADALNILSKNRNWLSESMIPTVITPHMKELSRLTGHNIQYLKENLVQVCEAFTREYGVICIAKDTRTMIIDNFETIYINLSGNNGMSTGGSGDILTGMIAGLCGQHMPLNQAARLGVYLHGRAGDIAASSKGFHSMTASDVLNAIPELLKKITMN